MATIYFEGARVENITGCNMTIEPCGIRVPSNGYRDSVRCVSNGVYADRYGKFYSWDSTATLRPGDTGIFISCTSSQVKLQIIRTCPNCAAVLREEYLTGRAR